MGLIITELEKRRPDLPYFQEDYEGEYPSEAPFTIGELEEIYPTASAYAKENEEYREKALQATFLLQNGRRGYRAAHHGCVCGGFEKELSGTECGLWPLEGRGGCAEVYTGYGPNAEIISVLGTMIICSFHYFGNYFFSLIINCYPFYLLIKLFK